MKGRKPSFSEYCGAYKATPGDGNELYTAYEIIEQGSHETCIKMLLIELCDACPGEAPCVPHSRPVLCRPAKDNFQVVALERLT